MRDLQRHYDPRRFEEVARLHANAFGWRRQGRIPLGIHVQNPEHVRGLGYDQWLDPAPFFEAQHKALCDTLEVGSDVLPHVAINHVGDSVLTTMFGAELFVPTEIGGTLQDVGPTPLQAFSKIEEVASIGLPTLDAGLMPSFLRMMRYYRERLPPWVHLVSPMPAGAFSTALELRGADMLIEMVDKPELCRRLIALCAQLQINAERAFRAISWEPLAAHVSNFGVLGAGLRIGDDSMVNLSPEMIGEFCIPSYRMTAEQLGGRGHIHFCTLPHSRFDHIFPALADSDEVAVASSQFAFEYYADHVEELRGRLAIETFYGDAIEHVRKKYGSFEDFANEFVPRFKNEAGLVMYCTVQTVEEGREIWEAWRRAHGGQGGAGVIG
ncbi:MAG: hypothetical protein V2A58_07050 [Planctomycetota bacterium]